MTPTNALLAVPLLGLVLSAPAPLPKPPPSARHVVGTWQMRHGRILCSARFDADGRYEAWLGPSRWNGRWVLDRGVLTVREWDGWSPEPPRPYVFRVRLHRPPGRGKGVLGMLEPARTDPFRLAPSR